MGQSNSELQSEGLPEPLTGKRKMLQDVLLSPVVEATLALAVLTNLVCMVIDTDRGAAGEDPLLATEALDAAILALFTIEFGCKAFVYRSRVFRNPWNLFDCFVLFVDYAMMGVGSLLEGFPIASLRTARLLRLARSARVLKMFPELALMVLGMVQTMKIVFCGIIMLSGFLTVVGILSVHILHPVNERVASKGLYDGCERCPRAFKSTFNSALTFTQQIVTGDSWGTISIPVIEEEPATFIFIALVFVCIGMMMLNIILSMVVDASMKAATDDSKRILKEKQAESVVHARRMREICEQLDTDGSGRLNKEELISGFADHDEFQDLLRMMDIDLEDIDEVFCALDSDNSGDIDYAEFITQMHKMKAHDTKTTEFIVKRHVSDIKGRLARLEHELQMILARTSLGESREPHDMELAGKTVEEAPSTLAIPDLRQSFSLDVSRLLADLERMAGRHAERLNKLQSQPTDAASPSPILSRLFGARSPTTRRRHGRCRRDPAEGRPDGPRPPKNPEGQRCSPPAETGGPATRSAMSTPSCDSVLYDCLRQHLAGGRIVAAPDVR